MPVFAIAWAIFVLELVSPATIWVPSLIQNAGWRGGSTLVVVSALPALLRFLWAHLADRTVTRRGRFTAFVAAGAAWFALSWAATRLVPESNAALFLVTLSMSFSFSLTMAAVEGSAVATGRRLGAAGPIAAAFVLASVGAGLTWSKVMELFQTSSLFATAAPIALALSLLAFVWPARRTAPLGTWPPLGAPPLGDQPRPKLSWRVLGSVALVVFFASPWAFEAVVTRHLQTLGDQAWDALWTARQVGIVAGAVLYALLCRRFPLRVLLPAALVLAAAGTVPLPYVAAPRALALAGAALGLGQTIAGCALTHLRLHASPPGREALSFALLALPRAAGATVVTMLMFRFEGPTSFERLPAVALTTCALALLATRLIPRDLLGDGTVSTWPTRRKATTEPTASDASSSGPSPG